MPDRPSDFYSGLVAQLYEPLAGSLADPDQYVRFVTKSGTPALELACGAGHPMLDLVSQGLETWGIDSSQDMLDQCQAKADQAGLQVNVQRQLMQALNLDQQFACCYIAGASFCLMDRLDDASETLNRVYQHLQPKGAFMLSVFRPKLAPQPGPETTKVRDDGAQISVQSVNQKTVDSEQLVITRLRYSVQQAGVIQQSVEKDWTLRWYKQQQLASMLEAVGFLVGTAYDFDGSKSEANSCNFSIVARKPG